IPANGAGTTTTRIAEVWDKGKAAVIVQEGETVDADGTPLWTTRSSIFARGEGGFGGERGPSEKIGLPEREPDAVADAPILPQQALLYRLCGEDRKSTRLNSSHVSISYAVFCLKKKTNINATQIHNMM